MAIRALSGTTNIFLFYSALQYIPLAEATIFSLSVPVFVFIFARIFLKEPFGRWHVAALVLSIVGIALASKIDFGSLIGGSAVGTAAITNVTQNGTLFTSEPSPAEEEEDSSGRLIGIAFCIGSVATASFVYVALRKVKVKVVAPKMGLNSGQFLFPRFATPITPLCCSTLPGSASPKWCSSTRCGTNSAFPSRDTTHT